MKKIKIQKIAALITPETDFGSIGSILRESGYKVDFNFEVPFPAHYIVDDTVMIVNKNSVTPDANTIIVGPYAIG
jgi:hypothetical protein